MTLRAKILLAQTPLAGALVLIALLSAFTNAALGRNAASILQDNYRSVLAAERMKEALERIDSAAMFIVAGERDRGLAQAEQNFPRFERELAVQQSNITERGEPEATAVLRRAWADYRAALRSLHRPRRSRRAGGRVLPDDEPAVRRIPRTPPIGSWT